MSSKKAMEPAKKKGFGKHRSNITNSRYGSKKLNFFQKINKKNKKN